MDQQYERPAQGDRGPVDARPEAEAPVLVTKMQIDLPVITIVKVVVTIALILLLGQIWPILFLVFLGLFVAMVLARPVSWLEDRGLPRGSAIAGVLGTVIALVVLFLW